MHVRAGGLTPDPIGPPPQSPVWGPTTFATPESAARAAEEIVRALEGAPERRRRRQLDA